MKLQVSQLQEGENRLEYSTEKNEELRKLVDSFGKAGHKVEGNFRVALQLTKLDPNYYLRGKMHFLLKPECSRCAESFPYPVDHAFELGLVHLSTGKPQRSATLAEETEELDLNWFSDNELVLDPILEEQFYLSLPFQPVCEPDCKGICQSCGKNQNEGPCGCAEAKAPSAFEVLKKLKV
jgi:uncharacterized protein